MVSKGEKKYRLPMPDHRPAFVLSLFSSFVLQFSTVVLLRNNAICTNDSIQFNPHKLVHIAAFSPVFHFIPSNKQSELATRYRFHKCHLRNHICLTQAVSQSRIKRSFNYRNSINTIPYLLLCGNLSITCYTML